MSVTIDPKWERRVGNAMTTVAIGATVGIVFMSGMLFQQHIAPQPCISNLADPLAGAILNLQPLLDDVTVYPADSEFAQAGIKDSRALAWRLAEQFNQDNPNTEEIYIDTVTSKEYWIPARCYAVIDAIGRPILYKKD